MFDSNIRSSIHHSAEVLLKVQNTVGTQTCCPGVFSISFTAIGISTIQLK
jgi:hypothetical protein